MEIESTELLYKGGYLGVGASLWSKKGKEKANYQMKEKSRSEKRWHTILSLISVYSFQWVTFYYSTPCIAKRSLTIDVPRIHDTFHHITTRLLVTHTHRFYAPRNACWQRNKGCCYVGVVPQSARQDHWWMKRKGKSFPTSFGASWSYFSSFPLPPHSFMQTRAQSSPAIYHPRTSSHRNHCREAS
jgi:hypothetical protein